MPAASSGVRRGEDTCGGGGISGGEGCDLLIVFLIFYFFPTLYLDFFFANEMRRLLKLGYK